MTARVLIAGAGNVFCGDDGFGPEVLARLQSLALPDGVSAKDFGVRGMHLLYELGSGYDAAILVDTVARGGTPGTLYVLEPHELGPSELDTHDMHPARALGLIESVGQPPRALRVVGCEPAHIPVDELEQGLSEPVARAVESAMELVRSLAIQ
jgi:hydrogenase maturation protease